MTAKAQPPQVREAEQVLFELLGEFLLHRTGGGDGRLTLRLKENCNLRHLETEIENLVQRLKALSTSLANIASDIEGFTLDGENEQARELAMLAEQGLALATDIEFVCQGNSQEHVYWLDGQVSNQGYINISLHAVPIEVGMLLHSLLYAHKDSVIFTSATLTVDGSFAHFKRRSGVGLVKPERLKKIRVDSPFHYDTQSLLYVLNDLPEQRAVPEQDYLKAMSDVIGDLANACQGRTLVLFTAHRVLREVYHRLKPTMEEQDILLLGHDIDGSRSKLVEEFKGSQRAVLFGAASFWEGLDVPGNALSCVVLVKLPFWPPNVPVVEARTEALKQDKLDGFLHFSLPEAVIKFKQGFGRLIRTKYDRGVVVVLDRRIVDKRYGQKFLNSLPISTYLQGNKGCLLDKVKAMLAKENTP
jgi:ATP-dependent DNA helicase DinG